MLASVKDLYFHGSLRVVLKPLLQKLPLVGGVEVAIIFRNLNFHWNEFDGGLIFVDRITFRSLFRCTSYRNQPLTLDWEVSL